MPGATPSYPPEFKREAVRLVQFSPNRSIAQIARELGVSYVSCQVCKFGRAVPNLTAS
jgi:transposase-like protein